MKILAVLLIAASIIQAQSATAHKIPFASEGNSIELAILNSSSIDIQNVQVETIDLPAWVKFAEKKKTITELASTKEGIVAFNFKVDKEAPVGEMANLKFQIMRMHPHGTSSTGEVWTKEISISVSPPEEFELYQNYPNPFNPSTTIEYLLPVK